MNNNWIAEKDYLRISNEDYWVNLRPVIVGSEIQYSVTFMDNHKAIKHQVYEKRFDDAIKSVENFFQYDLTTQRSLFDSWTNPEKLF